MPTSLYVVIIWGETMKRTSKIFIILTVIVIFFLIIVTIHFAIINLNFYHHLETRPTAQENTMWISENNKMLLRIDEKGMGGTLYLEQNNLVQEYYFTDARGYYAEIYSIEVTKTNILTPEQHYETWIYKNVEENTFTIAVDKSTFTRQGKEITFRKIEDGSLSKKTGDS